MFSWLFDFLSEHIQFSIILCSHGSLSFRHLVFTHMSSWCVEYKIKRAYGWELMDESSRSVLLLLSFFRRTKDKKSRTILDKNALLYSYCKNNVWTFKKKLFQLCLDFLPSEENVSASSIIIIIPSRTDENSHLTWWWTVGRGVHGLGWCFSTQSVLGLKNSQLNSIQLITCIEINWTQPIRVGLMGCALVVTFFKYYNKFWIFINYWSVCFQ